MPSSTTPATSAAHAAEIADQFTRQAEIFARSPRLHATPALDLLVDASRPRAQDTSLDVACGPGTVVAAFAARVAHATGLDATEAMLDEGRKLAAARALSNVAWVRGDVTALPFADATFDIVSCRFAFHHFEQPAPAFSEMARVCRPGGRVLVCDAVVSGDPVKAAAFNAMELWRDPSTVAFRTEAYLTALFADAGLPQPSTNAYRLTVELEALLCGSFPTDGDREALRASIVASIDRDTMGVNARRAGALVEFDYPVVVLTAAKP